MVFSLHGSIQAPGNFRQCLYGFVLVNQYFEMYYDTHRVIHESDKWITRMRTSQEATPYWLQYYLFAKCWNATGLHEYHTLYPAPLWQPDRRIWPTTAANG
jgi:hypothetical protein